MDVSQGRAGNEISRPGTSKVSFHKASGRKFIISADVRPIPLLKPKCSVPIYQAKLSRASCAKLFFLQVAVAGVSVEEILFAVKETSNEKAIWNKE